MNKKLQLTKRVMVVDDSAALRQVMAVALRGAGYEVIECCDGKEALGRLNGLKVHLIISDVHMPNIDGITFLKNLQEMPNYKFTPVIMLAGEPLDAENGKTEVPGAKAWIAKPFKPVQMVDVVSRLLMM